MNANASRLLCAGLAGLTLSLGGCMSASQHRASVSNAASDRLNVGTGQEQSRTGMSGAQGMRTLGAPNIVTTDEARREVWVYDKIATEVVQSGSAIQFTPLGLLTGGSGLIGGALGVGQTASASARSDRTLTVIIKFDENKRVRDFAYRATQF